MSKKNYKTEEIEIMEKELFYSNDEEETPPKDIVVYNELRSAADLFRIYKSGRLEIQPDFQRDFVWDSASQTRFIDSLIKQLPIPSMCFSLDNTTQKWKVVDGLQRISTIIKFFELAEVAGSYKRSDGDESDRWKLSKLSDIKKEISGKTPREVKENNSELYSRIENVTLPINILRVDYSKKSHSEYMFMIFRRLNENGFRLSNQEIRNAVYQGNFNDLIKELNSSELWGGIMGRDKIDRYRRVELILRFFAFYEKGSSYRGKLSSFLNNYMFENKNISEKEISSKMELFYSVIGLVGKDTQSSKIFIKTSNTVKEAMFYGIARNIDNLQKRKSIKVYMQKLLASEPFNDSNIREGIMKNDKVQRRLKMAEEIFSN